MRMEIVLKAVPTIAGSWTTVFAAVINEIDSSNVLFAAAREEALLVSASPMPPDEILKLLETSLNLSTILKAKSLLLKPFISSLNAAIVEIKL